MLNISQRQADLAVLVIQLIATLLLLIGDLFNQGTAGAIILTGLAVLVYGGLLWAYLHGWGQVRYIAIILLTILVAIAIPEPFVTRFAPFVLLLAPVLALVIGGPVWVLVSAALTLIIMLIRAGGQGVYTDPTTLILIAMIVGALVVSRLVSETSQRQAETKTGEAEAQARELALKEEALRLSEQRFRALIENVSDGIVVLDLEGRITYRSPSMNMLSGYTDAERLGRSSSERVHPDDMANFQANLQAVVTELGAVRRFEYRSQRKNESWRWLEVVMTNLLAEPGVQGIVVNVRDITARKEVEADLAARNAEIQSMSQQLWQAGKLATMGELSASIAHELNNPLATISLRLEGLLAATPPDHPNHRSLSIIVQETERMSRLVANVLQFSHPNTQHFSTVDIHQEIANSLELIGYLFQRQSIQVKEDYRLEPATLQANAQQLRQLFLNLFTNAVDAMPNGGTLSIRTANGVSNEKREIAVIEITDTGSGIEPANLPRVFEPFFTTKPEGQGTGLGLMICRRIVQAHQGTLEITSSGAPGQGTSVYVELPVQLEPDVIGGDYGSPSQS